MLVSLAVWSRVLAAGGGAASDAHLGQDLPDGPEDAAHLAFAQPADAAYAKAVRDGQLARVDDVAAAREPAVEGLEVELGVGRHAHRDDDRRLERVRQQGLEAERAQALDEDPAVARIAGTSPRHPALGGVLGERLVEGRQHVGRW